MIDKNALKEILDDWSYWTKPLPRMISRKILTKSLSLDPDLILVIQGVRRCGKSTSLAQIMLLKDLDPKSCFFINFEDPRLSENLNSELLSEVLRLGEEQSPKGKRYFFLDEIQNVENWEKWLHQQVERPRNNHFIITGSNATLLSGDLGTALTGRHLTLELFPFDFYEFKELRTKEGFDDFLSLGGFPRPLTHSSPASLLREYFNDIIEKDVRRHVSVRSSSTLQQLMKVIFESMGSEISQRKLAKLVGVSADMVGTYLNAATSAYLITPCTYFTFSEKQAASRNRKFYPIDLGLRNAVITRTGKDHGKSLEAVVFHYLRKTHKTVHYWRGNGEVDFITNDENGITPYQVTWEEAKERHYRAYEEFIEKFPQSKKLKIINRSNVENFLKT